jgi:hypothetical protein
VLAGVLCAGGCTLCWRVYRLCWRVYRLCWRVYCLWWGVYCLGIGIAVCGPLQGFLSIHVLGEVCCPRRIVLAGVLTVLACVLSVLEGVLTVLAGVLFAGGCTVRALLWHCCAWAAAGDSLQ